MQILKAAVTLSIKFYQIKKKNKFIQKVAKGQVGTTKNMQIESAKL